MSQIYKNKTKTNNGLHPVGQGPLDDRSVFDLQSDLYINNAFAKQHALYNRAYKGMQVTVFDPSINNKAVQLVLYNPAPYTPGGTESVNEDNFEDYWTICGNVVEKYITEVVDTSLNDIQEIVNESRIYFNGYEADDNMATISPLGSLPAGTTIAQLEQMTLSDILKAILFETAEPVLNPSKTTTNATISWNNYSDEQEVGALLPDVANVAVTFTSKEYQCKSSTGSVIATYKLSKFNDNDTEYYNNTTGNTNSGVNMKSSSYVALKENGVLDETRYVYVNVHYDGYQDAKNTAGVVRFPKESGTVKATPVLSYTGMWHVYTNASKASATSLYSLKNTNPGAFKGNSVKDEISATFAKSGAKYYLQWPNNTLEDDEFFVYVPSILSITSALQASDTKDNVFDNPLSCTLINSNITITNINGKSRAFKQYKIAKAAGITTAQITLD